MLKGDFSPKVWAFHDFINDSLIIMLSNYFHICNGGPVAMAQYKTYPNPVWFLGIRCSDQEFGSN